MFINILLVSLGGAIGAVLRFSVSPQIDKLFSSNFPYGIFLVNIIGCFFIGLLGIILIIGTIAYYGLVLTGQSNL